jgi:ABC-2 type transport system ATP-binding protein
MPAIAVENLSKRYRRKVAVDAVSFEIAHGEIVGFLGPNGAGKTTTLRMLAGLIRPSQGHASILDVRTPGKTLAHVGTMIEEPSFYPYLSGFANLKHAALLHGGVEDNRIQEILGFVSMDNAAGKKVGAYSQGMRQRLGLARALLWQPKVLLLDEPTNGLDPVGIAEIRDNLIKIAEQGVTILISSHILAELEKLVDRVLVIERGKLLFDGSLQKLTERVGDAVVHYHLDATDPSQLMQVLTELGYEHTPTSEQTIRVGIPRNDMATFLKTLADKGVSVLEAAREKDSLEAAYLRLLKEDGRPS